MSRRKVLVLIAALQAPKKGSEAMRLVRQLRQWPRRVVVRLVRVGGVAELQQVVEAMQPDVVHVFGHCTPGGWMLFMDDAGLMLERCTKAWLLAAITHSQVHVLQLVYLNAPIVLADLAAGEGRIQVLAGMRRKPDLLLSRGFVEAFYEELFRHLPLVDAFHRALRALPLDGQQSPLWLQVAPGVNPKVWTLAKAARMERQRLQSAGMDLRSISQADEAMFRLAGPEVPSEQEGQAGD